MKSKELATLAGISVRTLRHYHQIGILPEPPRAENGYRQYDVHDLIRVLRIRQLAALGIPLDQTPVILDAPEQNSSIDILDDLDRVLEAQIDRLTRQRALIAEVRAQETAPDLPPELARYLSAFNTAEIPEAMIVIDREQSILLAHLFGEQGISQLAAFYERVSEPDLFPAMIELVRRFDALDDGSSEGAIESLVEYFLATFTPLIKELSDTTFMVDSGTTDLFDRYHNDRLNTAQRSFLKRIAARID